MSDTLPTGEQLARVFHETYERMAPYYGYETRIGTREFDPLTINGKLMIATCEEVLRPFVSALSDATTRADKLLGIAGACLNGTDYAEKIAAESTGRYDAHDRAYDVYRESMDATIEAWTAPLRAYAELIAGNAKLACDSYMKPSGVMDFAQRCHHRNIESLRAALAKNPNPAGPCPATEASVFSPVEASGAGGAGTVLTGAQGVGDSASADPAVTGSRSEGTKAGTPETKTALRNEFETGNIPASRHPDLWDYHVAPSGEGPHAATWADKPHRIVYDLTAMLARERELRHQSGKKWPPLPEGDVPDHQNIADMLPSMLLEANARCPLCGQQGSHPHSAAEIVIYRNGVKYGRMLVGERHQVNRDPVAVLDEWSRKNKAPGDHPEFWRGYHYAREVLYGDSQSVACTKQEGNR